MLTTDSMLKASLRKQRQYEKLTEKAEDILESQFGEVIYKRIIESISTPIRRRKFYIRTEADPKRIIAWAIAQRIREAREKQGLRQEDLAVKSGIARPNIARLERGRHIPTLSTLQKIAMALRLDMNNLMAGPVVTQQDKLEFTGIAEAGLNDWVKRLEEEDAKD